MDNIFDKLNSKQIEAVTSTEGYVRIIAGAGSGKTKTLTHRYAYLALAAGIHPGNILCVTFTNKAAGEMKRRVRAIVGEGCDTSLITTYHGFCVRVLREDAGRLFYPQNFRILDESAQKAILEEIYAELELKLDRASFEKMLEKIHLVKSDEKYVSMFVSGEFGVKADDSSDDNIVRMYMQKEKNVFGLDFDDLICFTFAIFESYPEVLEKWQDRLHYIQVDEFQDSSKRELKLVSMLSDVHKNLFVVGDPDQNIYEWRGADMSILVDFDKTFPGTETVFLNRNYRSTERILKCANTLISKNKNRIPKALYTVDNIGDEVVCLHSKNEHDEGKWITDEIKRLVKNEGYSYRDIAILYRSGFLSRFAEQALSGAGIPYELYGSVRFYERMEIKDVLAYLKLIAYNDNEALMRVVNTPKRMFGKTKVERLKMLAEERGVSYYDALCENVDIPEFKRSSVKELVLLIEEMRSKYKGRTVSETLSEVLVKSGYEKYIRETGNAERLDNLAEFKRSCVDSERERGEEYSLEEFLSDIAIKSDYDTDDEKRDMVKLMTIHASKGLEFPVCFVCGFTDGIFPSGRTLEERKDAGLEEERRLCFVALTRAMKRLYLTESEGSSGEGSRSMKKRPSRFIYEIGEENYRHIGEIPKELRNDSAEIKNKDGKSKMLSVGDEVEHPLFGHGVVRDIDEKRSVYNIKFDKSADVKPVGMDYDFEKWRNIAEMKEKALKAAEEKKPNRENEQLSMDIALPDNTDSSDISDKDEDLPEITEPVEIADLPEESTVEPKEADSSKQEEVTEIVVEPEKKELPPKYRNAEWLKPIDLLEENLWKRDDVPHDGWSCVDIIDLGEPVGVCRMCGYQIIRYVHIMEHPNFPRKIGAGCICAGRMEGDVERAKERESVFKNRLSRKETFLSMKLKRSKNGNEYFKYKGEIVTVLPDRFKKGQYKAVYGGNYTNSYSKKEDALLEVFEMIDPPLKFDKR